MRNVVTGLMMLAGAVVRDKGHGIDDFGWRREMQQAREAQTAAAATSTNAGDGWGATAAIADDPTRGALMSVSAPDADQAAPGDWDVACEREAGDRLVFDRGSVRDLGGATLFRWAPTGGVVPNNDDTIYTALADCRAKSIEASWPGKRSETRAGTCGRDLVDAVCAVRSAVKTPILEQDRLGQGRGGAHHGGASHASLPRGNGPHGSAPHASALP